MQISSSARGDKFKTGLPTNMHGAFSVALFAISSLTFSLALHAQSFSAVVSPPRFEVAVQQGKTIRQVIEISQASSVKGNYRIYTNDWTIGADGNAVFADELAPNSCRPWVSIERKELTIAPNGKIRFRFEITPPANVGATECRFALMIEGTEQVIKTEGAISFPVSGRIGVIVYASVGDASPILEISQAGTSLSDGMTIPTLSIKNVGNAHGRPVGFLKGVDGQGQSFDFSPESLPILPGQTRAIRLIPQTPQSPQGQTAAPIKLVYPLKIKGAIEWSELSNSKKTDIDFRFDQPAPASAPAPAPALTPTPAPVKTITQPTSKVPDVPAGSGVSPK